MSRRTRVHSTDSTLIFWAVVVSAAWTHHVNVVYAIYALGIALAFLAAFKAVRYIKGKHINTCLADIDSMVGLEFERYIANLLKRQGFKHIRLTERYDMGVDIIARKDGITWGIQVKHYSNLVGVHAIQQVVAGLAYYNCYKPME